MIKDFIELIRPVNDLMVGLGVIVGYIMTLDLVTVFPFYKLLLGFITGFLVSASVMVFNDIIDLPIDKVNKPNRPLPSGRVTVKKAFLLGIILGVAGLIASYLTGIVTLIVAVTFWIVGVSYNYKFKGTPLAGNMIVSLSVAIPFIYGSLLNNGTDINLNVILLSLTAFFINTYREVIKDIADIEGDKKKNLATLPIILGPKKSFLISTIYMLTGLIIGFTPLIIYTGLNRTLYGPILAISEILILLSWINIYRSDLNKEVIERNKKVCLLGMFFGMLAFLLSKVVILIV